MLLGYLVSVCRPSNASSPTPRPAGSPGPAGLRRLWELFWSLAGAVPVRFKILGIALGMVLTLGLAIVVTLWFTLPGALLTAQDEGPRAVMAILTRDLLYVTAGASLIGIFSAFVLTWVLTDRSWSWSPRLARFSGASCGSALGSGRGMRSANWRWRSIACSRVCAPRGCRSSGPTRSCCGGITSWPSSRMSCGQKEQIRAQLLEKVISAQEDERKRIARELHDDTSQALTSLVVGLKVLEGLHDPGQVRAQVAELRDLAAGTLDSVHRLALELRPSVLDDLGLVAAVQRHLAAQSRKNGLDVDFHTSGLDGVRLPAETETALYRIIQEALANVIRHSRASTASVVLERRRESLVAIVEDDGHGFDADAAARLGAQPRAARHARALLPGGRQADDRILAWRWHQRVRSGAAARRSGRGAAGESTGTPDRQVA